MKRSPLPPLPRTRRRRALSALGRAFGALALGLSSLLAGLLLAALLLALKPEWFLDSGTLGFALERFGAAFRPRWSALELEIDSLAFNRKRVRLGARRFCVAHERGLVSGCLKSFELDATVSYSGAGFFLERIDRLNVDASTIRVARAAARSRRRAPELRPPPRLIPAWLSRLAIGRVSIALPSLTLAGPGGPRRWSLAARERQAPAGRRLRLSAAGPALEAELSIGSDALAGGPLRRVDAEGLLRLAARRLKGRVELTQSESLLEARGRATLRQDGALRELSVEACRLALPLAARGRPASAALRCRYSLRPRPFGPGPARPLEGRLRLDARSRGDTLSAELDATLGPVVDWYRFAGRLSASAEGRLGEPLKRMKLSHDLALTLSTERFSHLVRALSSSAWAVPAPFHVLEGPIRLELESRGRPRQDPLEAELRLTSALASRRQRVALAGRSSILIRSPLTLDRSAELDAELTLKDLALELPYLEIGALPRLTVDQRIGAPAPSAVMKGNPAFPLAWRARVATARPARLLSNLAKSPVSISLELGAATAALPSGLVHVHSFPIELFRRTATVDHVRVTLDGRSRVGEIDGLVIYKTAEATVKILLAGPANKPRVELQSEPPMDKQQIIALLLYGKSPSELDADQSATVGNAESALTGGAFGLGSLYLFASTPVEHVGYDPATRSYTVKLRIPGGATMELGSDLERTRHLRLRKRLARHWALETELRESESEPNAVTTFLEWFNRY